MTSTTQPSAPTGTSFVKKMGGRRRFTPTTAGFITLIAIDVALTVAIVFVPMDPVLMGALLVLLSITLLLSGVYVAAAMALAGALGMVKLIGFESVALLLGDAPFLSAANFSLTVLPMYVLLGALLYQSGITPKVYMAARQWLGRVPGGLAVSTNISGGALASVSGSTLGIAIPLGRIGIPEMLKSGYKPGIAIGSVAAAGVLGQMIPPSTILVIYAGIAGTPVGPQIVAAIIPGIILMFAFAGYIIIAATTRKGLAPKVDSREFTWGSRWRALAAMWELPVLLFIIFGTLMLGWATVTEAGALAAFVALLMSIWADRKAGIKVTGRHIGKSLAEAASVVAIVTLLLAGVAMLMQALTLTGVVEWLTLWVSDLGLSTVWFLIALVGLYLILGMFMDTLAMIAVSVPVLLPILAIYDVSPIWFGIFVVLMAEIGMITPPIGVLAYVLHAFAQNKEVNLGRKITLGAVFRGCIPFVVVGIAVTLLLIFLPDIALWLPEQTAGQ